MMQLALFGFDHEPAPSSPGPVRRGQALAPDGAAAQPPAAQTRSAPHAEPPLASARTRAPWTHPQSNRATILQGQAVAYHLRRGRRRTIGFLVGADGLVVSAPRWVLVADIERAVAEKARWIVSRLHEAQERSEREQALRMRWGDGTQLPFLGESLTVVLDPRELPASARLRDVAQQPVAGPALGGIATKTLHVGLPHDADTQRIRDCVQAWLMREARAWFAARLDHFAPRLGVRWTRLSLSNASTRWGTAHADGHIRLNWRLIHLAPPVIDYVVAHELSHLRVMDHSPRFWDTVASVVPDYGLRRAALRNDTVPRWD